jgi:hypothetical protein
MDKPQLRQPLGGGLASKCFVLIRRGALPPLPWMWEVHYQGRPDICWRAVRGYKSAEDAWEAGQAALARLSLRYSPEPAAEWRPGTAQAAPRRGE